jgi:hypothetical protein
MFDDVSRRSRCGEEAERNLSVCPGDQSEYDDEQFAAQPTYVCSDVFNAMQSCDLVLLCCMAPQSTSSWKTQTDRVFVGVTNDSEHSYVYRFLYVH